MSLTTTAQTTAPSDIRDELREIARSLGKIRHGDRVTVLNIHGVNDSFDVAVSPEAMEQIVRLLSQDNGEDSESSEQSRRRAGLEELAAFTQEIGLEY